MFDLFPTLEPLPEGGPDLLLDVGDERPVPPAADPPYGARDDSSVRVDEDRKIFRGDAHKRLLEADSIVGAQAAESPGAYDSSRVMTQSRRRFLRHAATAASAACVAPRILAATGASMDTTTRGAEAMEEALGLLAKTGPEYAGRLANHGPMAAEALVVLGRPDAVVPWVESYRRRLYEHPAGGHADRPKAWREALGQDDRVGDWIVFFDRQVEERPWKDVLAEWVPRLAPGVIAAAFHGVIRTAHAVRSLDARESRARRRELAEGLGYWAATYEVLPESRRAPRAIARRSRRCPRSCRFPPTGRSTPATSRTASRRSTASLPSPGWRTWWTRPATPPPSSRASPRRSPRSTSRTSRPAASSRTSTPSRARARSGSSCRTSTRTRARRCCATAGRARRRSMRRAAGSGRARLRHRRRRATATTSWTARSRPATSTRSSSPRRACASTR